jgi:hypothetical protein
MLLFANHYTRSKKPPSGYPHLSFSGVLPHEIDRERLWKDAASACVEIARIDFQNTERGPQQQEPEQSKRQRKRKKNGAARFFPESDEEMENENHRLPLDAIVADKIRKYQLDTGLKLETDGSYNCTLKWGSLNHSNYPSVWKLEERILPILAMSAPGNKF